MSTSNPYAPPESRGEAPPRQEDWYTEGTLIYVSDGAVLPAIDLETGEDSDDLIEVKRRFAIAGATIGIWGVIPGLFNALPREWKRQFRLTGDDLPILIGALLILFAIHAFIALGRPHLLGKCVRFRMHRNETAERKAKRIKIVVAVWYCLSLVVMLTPAIMILSRGRITDPMKLVFSLMGVGVISMLACVVWQLLRMPKIRFKGFSGKWLRVTGACDEALVHLRKIESERFSQNAV